jgi:alpha-glucosidase
MRPSDGWACWAFSNHDVVRHATRWGEPVARTLPAAARRVDHVFLRGSVCLYQGEELGLTEADVAYEDLQDPYGIRSGRTQGPRRLPHADGLVRATRTAVSPDGEPWLPVPVEHRHLAVDAQEPCPGSDAQPLPAMMAFRKAHPALAKGSFTLVDTGEAVLSFHPRTMATKLFCAFNMSEELPVAPPGRVEPLDGAVHRIQRRYDHAAAYEPWEETGTWPV